MRENLLANGRKYNNYFNFYILCTLKTVKPECLELVFVIVKKKKQGKCIAH